MTSRDPKSEHTPPNNLPVQITSLVGREQEMAAAAALLSREDVRLLTLTGPPGIGKTRLAIQIADSILARFPDGTFFVDLSPVSDPAMVIPVVAHALGLRHMGKQNTLDGLKALLHSRQTLLVLDNLEHVISAAPQLFDLLVTTMYLKALVTSRELLHLSGEHNFPVAPLSLPPVLADHGSVRSLAGLGLERIATYDAVKLFAQRAGALDPGFALTEGNALVIAGICSRLDGLPLPIELAAARIRHLPPQAILDRLQSRLGLLTEGTRDLPPRQKTLRATIEWSYNLLNEEEQQLLRRLAVFQGGSTLDALDAVCNADRALGTDLINIVGSLVDKSLLKQSADRDFEARYLLLETIHEFASEKLRSSGEAGKIEEWHAHYYLSLSQEADANLRGPQQDRWLERLEKDHNNIRAALRWSSAVDEFSMGARLAAALSRFWERHSHFNEGRHWLSKALLSGSEIPLATRAKILVGAGIIAFRQGDYAEAIALESESLAAYRALGDKEGIAQAYTYLADSYFVSGDIEGATARFEQALALWAEVGNRWGIAKALLNLGELARAGEDYATAQLRCEQGLAIYREVGDRLNVGHTLHNLGHVLCNLGEHLRARECFMDSMLIAEELGNSYLSATCLLGAAEVAAGEGRAIPSAILFGAADAALAAIGGGLDPVDRADYDRGIHTARALVDEAAWQLHYAHGQALTLPAAVAYAREDAATLAAPFPEASAQTESVPRSGLTRREHEIATLIARGKSNREIAEVLVVSERTVEWHTGNILSKLGLQSRSQIALWAYRHILS